MSERKRISEAVVDHIVLFCFSETESLYIALAVLELIDQADLKLRDMP